jgi:hypothetical protein
MMSKGRLLLKLLVSRLCSEEFYGIMLNTCINATELFFGLQVART